MRLATHITRNQGKCLSPSRRLRDKAASFARKLHSKESVLVRDAALLLKVTPRWPKTTTLFKHHQEPQTPNRLISATCDWHPTCLAREVVRRRWVFRKN